MEPSSHGAVTVSLSPSPACGQEGAVCTEDGRTFTTAIATQIQGLPGLTVADAEVEEGQNASLAFAVTLSRSPSSAVTVDYATSDGTATAGSDYTAASGTLSFATGETEKTVTVAVLDDSHDEVEETLTLTLSNASATGTSKNSDPLPRAWLVRFGRTAALHVVEQVEQRIGEQREPGFRGRFGGQDLGELRPGRVRDRARDTALGTGTELATGVLGLGRGDALTGSAFALDREMSRGGVVSLWGRSAQSRFMGQQGALSLDGDVRTSMVGAEYARGPLLAGLALSHSRSLGSYEGVDGGQVASSVTGLYPWVGYKATDRITLWGVTGYGLGSLSLAPGIGLAPTTMGLALKSGLSMAMAAAGTRGELIGAGGRSGFRLAFNADALWVDTSTDDVNGPAGRLAGTDAAVTRFRTAFEGSRGFSFGSGLSLVPGVEVGLRHDGGDAERGSGVDIGGKLVVSSPAMGLTAELRMRTLLVHEAEGFRDRGVSVSLSFDPMPSTPLGFKARMEPSWGGRDQGGAEALWGGGPVSELAARGGHVSGGSVLTDLGYGMAPPSHPDLLAEKLQTRSILTLHLVSFQGVRSTVPSPIPAVQPTAFTQIPGHYLKEFGEYRTQRYVRRAFDQLERGELPGLNG